MLTERNIRQRAWAFIAGGVGLLAVGIGLMTETATVTEAQGVTVSDMVTNYEYRLPLQEELGIAATGVGLAVAAVGTRRLVRAGNPESTNEQG